MISRRSADILKPLHLPRPAGRLPPFVRTPTPAVHPDAVGDLRAPDQQSANQERERLPNGRPDRFSAGPADPVDAWSHPGRTTARDGLRRAAIA